MTWADEPITRTIDLAAAMLAARGERVEAAILGLAHMHWKVITWHLDKRCIRRIELCAVDHDAIAVKCGSSVSRSAARRGQ
jgi:hypothetical protein